MMKKITVSIENASKTNNGVFEGWGTSLCWWANRIGSSETLVRDSAKLFFSDDGLRLNIMRYNIGGGDDPSHNHITRTDSEMPGWWKHDKEKKKFFFNPNTDAAQLAMLDAAYKAAGENAYVEAFSNSPPYFMTVSGCSSGSKNAITNNLKKSCIKPFAEYLADVCGYIQKNQNIKIKSLAAMNEPFTNFWKAYSPKQEGCFVMPGRMQSNVLVATADALKKRGLSDIIVTASDETRTNLQYVAMKMLSKKALAAVGRISTHTYAPATANIGNLARAKGKNIWMSETDWSSVSGENSGEMGPALWLGEKIIEDINTISPSAWVIWQIVASYISKNPDAKGRLDMPGIPNLTQGFWGTAFADIDNEKIYLTQKYYAFGQFSRYIRPGMTIIHTGDKHTLAAVNKETGETVIVALNTNSVKEEICVEFKGISASNKTAKIIRTSGSLADGEHWAEVGESSLNGVLNATLKENSISTFLISRD